MIKSLISGIILGSVATLTGVVAATPAHPHAQAVSCDPSKPKNVEVHLYDTPGKKTPLPMDVLKNRCKGDTITFTPMRGEISPGMQMVMRDQDGKRVAVGRSTKFNQFVLFVLDGNLGDGVVLQGDVETKINTSNQVI